MYVWFGTICIGETQLCANLAQVGKDGNGMDDIILYHGSRGGIDGEIKPISRVRCDFGNGFYMGENEEQAKGLIVEDSSPILYTVKLKLSEISESCILRLNENDWIYAVLANRKRIKDFNKLHIADYWINELSKYDIVIGPIADDRMNEAMQRFSDYTLSDEGLNACLRYVNYGNQYVAKTEFACSKIEIISERAIIEDELDAVRKYSYEKRIEGRDIVSKMTIEYRNKGQYLDEILNSQRNIEMTRRHSVR